MEDNQAASGYYIDLIGFTTGPYKTEEDALNDLDRVIEVELKERGAEIWEEVLANGQKLQEVTRYLEDGDIIERIFTLLMFDSQPGFIQELLLSYFLNDYQQRELYKQLNDPIEVIWHED